MSARKPLEVGCTGGISCEVDEHIQAVRNGRGTTYRHIKLTFGQRKTLMERRRAEREGRGALRAAATQEGENRG